MKRSVCWCSLAVGAFLLAGCSDSPTAADSPLQAPHGVLMQQGAASAEATCGPVSGTIVGNVFTGSMATGDLAGGVWAYAAPILEFHGPSIHLATFHHFQLADGWFQTEDRGVQAPSAPPEYRLNNRYTIVRGGGAWAQASGFLTIHGRLVIDFTEQDPDHGLIDVTYRGRVCR
jgi:hypothetical protein